MAEIEKASPPAVRERARLGSAPPQLGMNVILPIYGMFMAAFFVVLITTPYYAHYIFIVLAFAATAVISIRMNSMSRNELKSIEITETGLSGTTYGKKQVNIAWDEVAKVVIHGRYVQVVAGDRDMKVYRRAYRNFDRILEALSSACLEKGIECAAAAPG